MYDNYKEIDKLSETQQAVTMCACGKPTEIALLTGAKCKKCYDAEHAYPSIDTLRATSDGKTRILYHLDFWDGPITGVMLWDNEKAFFKGTAEAIYDGVEILSNEALANEEKELKKLNLKYTMSDLQEKVSYRPFNVYRIPEDNMQAIEADHKRFQEHVGLHTDYNEQGKRGRGATNTDRGDLKPNSEWSKFYDTPRTKPKVPLDVTTCQIIGKFRIW